MAITIERVYEALEALQSQDTEQNVVASKWLADFQKSVFAWTIADQLLGEGRSFETCLFAAQTLRSKLLNSVRELPADAYAQLRDSLINQLSSIESRLGRSASSILIQLSAALSDLYIQIVEWKGFVSQMLVHFSSLPSSNSAFLILFKTLPEELYSRKLKVGENRRTEVEQELAEHTETVLNNLYQLCSVKGAEGNELRTKALSCLSSWLLCKRCPTDVLARSPLFHSVIGVLAQPNSPPELHDAATECVVNSLQIIDDTPSLEQEQLARLLQEGVWATVEAFRSAIQEENSDKLQNYARLYAENCEAFLTEIVRHPCEGFGNLRALDLLQLVNDYHDYSLVEMSFNVWYRLSEYLYQCDEADFDNLHDVFCAYIEKHVLALCRHCRIESDSQELLSGNSELADFRSKAQESVKDVTFIIGSVHLLRRLMEALNSSDSWDQMEAILFVSSAFVSNIVETEQTVVPLLLEAVLKFPLVATHCQLLKTSAQMLGNLQDWLETNSDYMVRAFNWFTSLFEVDGCILTMAECMEQLMERSWQEVQRRGLHNEYMSTMAQLLSRIELTQGKGQQMEQAAHHLLRASSHLINDLPSQQLCACLEMLCAKSVAQLREINKKMAMAGSTTSSLMEENKENAPDSWAKLQWDPVLWLDRISDVWRILKPWQQQLACKQIANERQEIVVDCPWLSLCTGVVECSLTTLQHHQQQQRVVEHACRTIRFLIRSMGAQSIVFIEPVASQIMLTYAQFSHSCLLYLSSILVDEYGAMAHIQQGMLQMLENLATCSMNLLASENGLRDNPDTVDDLYRLVIRFVQRSPAAFFSHPIVAQLFQGAIHGLCLNHQDANRSVTKFVLEIIAVVSGKRGSSIPPSVVSQVAQLLSDNGPQLVFGAVSAALFHLSNSLCKEMAEVVHALLQMDKPKTEQWLNFACMQLPHDGGHNATPEQLNMFRTDVLKSKRPFDVVAAMRELSKFYA